MYKKNFRSNGLKNLLKHLILDLMFLNSFKRLAARLNLKDPGARCRPAFWHGFPVAAVHPNHCFPPSLSLGETNAIFYRPSTIEESQIHRASSMSSVCVMVAAWVLLRPIRKCENVVRIFIVLNFLDLLSFPWRLPFQFFGFGGGSIS